MSTLTFLLLTGFNLISIIFAIISRRQLRRLRERVKGLKSGQSRWREIAMENSKKFQSMTAEIAELKFRNQGWQNRFRILVEFMWGAPALDRSLNNVMDAITELKKAASKE